MHQFLTTILENREILPNYFLLKISWENALFNTNPGQFINIKINNVTDPLLRRPFSIFNANNNSIEIIYKVIGKGTKLLSKKTKGNKIDIIGPLGNGYFSATNQNDPAIFKNIILIGGGTGSASLFYCAKHFFHNKIPFTALLGFKSKSEAFCIDRWKALSNNIIITTDDGTLGHKGFMTNKFNEIITPSSTVFACGPHPILLSLKQYCNLCTIKASFESTFGCGTGMCNGCPIKIQNSNEENNSSWIYKKICKDGPVFDLKTICF